MAYFTPLAGVVIGHWDLTTASFLAHQGGWDEMLMVAVPIGIFALLLRSANKRAARLEAEKAEQGDTTGSGDAGPPLGSGTDAEPRNPRGGPI